MGSLLANSSLMDSLTMDFTFMVLVVRIYSYSYSYSYDSLVY